MIDYAAARAVALVVQTGSFEAAARALNVSPSAVSQRVRNLEERIGAVLIERAAPCIATEKGAWLCRHMEQVGMLEKALLAQLPGIGGRGTGPVTLSIATNADSLGTWFLPAVAAFTAGSDYLLNIALDDEDHTADWLRTGRVVAAVTALARPVQGCEVKSLGVMRYIATASPGYMQRHFPDGVSAAALARAPALTFNQKDRLQQAWAQQAFGEAVPFPTHWLASTQGFVDASLVGLGWALNPVQLVEEHLAAGRLVALVPETALHRPLYWQVNRLAAGQLADLTQAIIRTARNALT
ncbi:LysR family transcriptional regulator ArgP [Pararhodobacter sp.]|uniref:LysR family transcriptional regulator ArgP n=1 Tax=Pararhodobacter sp. TaxID=2127056 RepID=UPI002FDE3D12